MATDSAGNWHPLLTVLVHPDDDPGRRNARRLMRVEAYGDSWPWRHITGPAVTGRPDLSDWTVQPLGDLALAVGHGIVLTGREVMAPAPASIP